MRGPDSEICEQALLAHVEVVVPGTLLMEPLAQGETGAGESCRGVDEAMLSNVYQGAVIRPSPGDGPGTIPPGIDAMQRLCPLYGERCYSGSLIG